jgi:hypothetical protein
LVPGVGGVDEAGRGPLAGPVVAAVVVFSAGQTIRGVRDSKQLSAVRRETLAEQIKEQAVGWALGQATVEEIDALNILQATMLAMRRAIEGLGFSPERLQFDGDRVWRKRLSAVIELALRFRQRRFLRRWIGTARCWPWTAISRIMDLHGIKAMQRPSIALPCGDSGPVQSIDTAFGPCGWL